MSYLDRISRRLFLRRSALAGVAIALPALPTPDDTEITPDEIAYAVAHLGGAWDERGGLLAAAKGVRVEDGTSCYYQSSYSVYSRCRSVWYQRQCCSGYPAHCHGWVNMGVVQMNNCWAYAMCSCCCNQGANGCYGNPYAC